MEVVEDSSEIWISLEVSSGCVCSCVCRGCGRGCYSSKCSSSSSPSRFCSSSWYCDEGLATAISVASLKNSGWFIWSICWSWQYVRPPSLKMNWSRLLSWLSWTQYNVLASSSAIECAQTILSFTDRRTQFVSWSISCSCCSSSAEWKWGGWGESELYWGVGNEGPGVHSAFVKVLSLPSETDVDRRPHWYSSCGT